MPDIDLLTISRAEALKVARAVFGMTPTQAEEFVTLARGEESEDVEPQTISIKAFGSYNEGKHKRYPKGDKRGGQFMPTGGSADRLVTRSAVRKAKTPISKLALIVKRAGQHAPVRIAAHAKPGLSKRASDKKYRRYMRQEQKWEGKEFKALGGFTEGLHPRIPAGSPKGGQFIKKAGRLAKRGMTAYWNKTRVGRQALLSAGAGVVSGSGSYNMGMGIMRGISGDVTGGLIQGTLGLAQSELGRKIYQKVGKRHKRNKRIYEAASLGTTFGRALGPGLIRGYRTGYQKASAFRNAKAHQHYMSTVMGLKPPKTVNLPKSKYRFHEVTMKAKKLPKLGSGARFAKLEGQLAKKGIRDPGALAAAIGRKKYGAKRFAKLSAHGRKEIELKAFSPAQKRYPKGSPKGGQWMPMLGAALRSAGAGAKKVGHGAKIFGLGAGVGAGSYHAISGAAHLNLGRLVLGEAVSLGSGTALARSYQGGHKIGRGKKAVYTGSKGERALSTAGIVAGAIGAAVVRHRKGLSAAGRGAARGASTRWHNRGIKYYDPKAPHGTIIDSKKYKFHEYEFKAVTTTHVEPKPILQIALEMRNKQPKNKKGRRSRRPQPIMPVHPKKIVHKELIPDDRPTGQIAAQPLVFKDVNDAYRWVLLSSNGYRDRDGELITTKALERDVALWELEGQPYQPLRWWHVALDDDYQHGLELGQTDLRVVHGHTLIESGTFDDPLIGEAVFKAQDELAASVGFRHSPNEPNADKMFEDVSIFERSLLPEAFSSNVLTDLLVTN